MQEQLSKLAKEEYCYLTTKGRKTGNPHEIEIWFCVYNDSIYLLSGGKEKSDWVKNILKDPNVSIRIAKETFSVKGRIVQDKEEEDETVRNIVADKYKEREKDGSLSEWARTALPVAFDLSPSLPKSDI